VDVIVPSTIAGAAALNDVDTGNGITNSTSSGDTGDGGDIIHGEDPEPAAGGDQQPPRIPTGGGGVGGVDEEAEALLADSLLRDLLVPPPLFGGLAGSLANPFGGLFGSLAALAAGPGPADRLLPPLPFPFGGGLPATKGGAPLRMTMMIGHLAGGPGGVQVFEQTFGGPGDSAADPKGSSGRAVVEGAADTVMSDSDKAALDSLMGEMAAGLAGLAAAPRQTALPSLFDEAEEQLLHMARQIEEEYEDEHDHSPSSAAAAQHKHHSRHHSRLRADDDPLLLGPLAASG